MAHSGLVIYSECPENCSYRVYVVDLTNLEDAGLPVIRRVDETAFYPSHNSEFSNSKERKMSAPLDYGAVISWTPGTEDEAKRDNEVIIMRFIRISSKSNVVFPTRHQNGVGQVSLEGIISPNDPAHLVTEYFRSIPIPDEQQKVAIPNVYYNTWITLKYNLNTGRLIILFDSFYGVCDLERQTDVGTMPWNKGKAKYSKSLLYKTDSEEDDEWDFQIPKKPKDPPFELHSTEAIRTGARSVYLPEHPGIKAILPLLNDNMYMKRGLCYEVSAIFVKSDNMFLIKSVYSSKGEKVTGVSSSGLFRTVVKENRNLRGVFEDETMGLMDDPKGILSFLHLSERAQNSVYVTVRDGLPSRGGQFRFQIENIHDEEEFRTDEPETKVLSQVSGLVVAENSVFSAEHSPMFFTIPDDCKEEKPGIGSFLKFTAVYNENTRMFDITEWLEDASKCQVEFVLRKMDPRMDCNQPIFLVSGKVPDHNKINKMLLTSEFGLVDDNLESIEFSKRRNPQNQYRVWVTMAHFSKDDPFCSRTVFHIVADGKNEPPEDRYAPPLVKKKLASSPEKKITFQEESISAKKKLEENRRNFENTVTLELHFGPRKAPETSRNQPSPEDVASSKTSSRESSQQRSSKYGSVSTSDASQAPERRGSSSVSTTSDSYDFSTSRNSPRESTQYRGVRESDAVRHRASEPYRAVLQSDGVRPSASEADSRRRWDAAISQNFAKSRQRRTDLTSSTVLNDASKFYPDPFKPRPRPYSCRWCFASTDIHICPGKPRRDFDPPRSARDPGPRSFTQETSDYRAAPPPGLSRPLKSEASHGPAKPYHSANTMPTVPSPKSAFRPPELLSDSFKVKHQSPPRRIAPAPSSWTSSEDPKYSSAPPHRDVPPPPQLDEWDSRNMEPKRNAPPRQASVVPPSWTSSEEKKYHSSAPPRNLPDPRYDTWESSSMAQRHQTTPQRREVHPPASMDESQYRCAPPHRQAEPRRREAPPPDSIDWTSPPRRPPQKPTGPPPSQREFRAAPVHRPVAEVHHEPARPPTQKSEFHTAPGLFSTRAPSRAFQPEMNVEEDYGLKPLPPQQRQLQQQRQQQPQHHQQQQHQQLQQYSGPVLMPPGSKNRYDVMKTMALIKTTYKHSDKCGLFCDKDCSWLRKVAGLVLDNDIFWSECSRYFPDIAESITKNFSSCNIGI